MQQTFDARGRLVERRVWHLDSFGSPVGDGYATTTVAYDDVARTVTVRDDLARATVIRQDGAGRTIQTVLPDGSSVATSHLDNGRRIVTSYPFAGTTQAQVTRLTAWGALASLAVLSGSVEMTTSTMSYDSWLRPTSNVTATGFSSTTSYDAFDRPVLGGASPGEQVSLVFDRDDRVIERRSQDEVGSSSWKFGFDALGRAWQTVDPSGATTSVEFDGLSDLPLITTDPRGTKFSYTWSASRQLEHLLADAPASISTMRDVSLVLTHDALGRLRSAVRDDGLDGNDVATMFSYDSFGNVLTEFDSAFGAGATRTHTYDNLSRPVSSVLGAHTVTRGFDALDRLARVRVGTDAPNTADFEYTGPGGPTARVLKNGVRTTYAYDPFGRLEQLTDAKLDGTQLARWIWEMPFDGVPRAAALAAGGLSTASVYHPDVSGRLIFERNGMQGAPFTLSPTATTELAATQVSPYLNNAAVRYTLNDRGSWMVREQNGAATAFGLDALDRYTSVAGTSPTYDAGNALTADGATTYSYDAFGQLASYESGTTRRTYQRDALGRIIAETNPTTGAVTRYTYDGLRRTFRKAPTGEVDVTIDGAGLDEHLTTILANGQRRYYHQDRLGSVYLITGDNGSPVEWVRYTAYGEPTILNPSGQTLTATAVGNRFGFQGQQHDWATSLVDMRARHYRPTWGRFLNPDPLGLASGSPNLYAFVDSAPLSFTDPLGLSKQCAEDGVCAGTIDAADLPFVAESIKAQLPDGFDPYVAVDDRDAKQSRSVRRSSVRGSLGYVDNAIQVRAKGDPLTLRLDELLFDTVNGGVAGVSPGALDYGAGSAISTSYETVGGITYPLDQNGQRIFDGANTPRILEGGSLVAGHLGRANDARFVISATVFSFIPAVAMGASGVIPTPRYGTAATGYQSGKVAFGGAGGGAGGAVGGGGGLGGGGAAEGGGVAVSPGSIRFSQRSVNGAADLTESMRANGWRGDPIDVVRMPDGELTAVDNTRVLAGHRAGIDVRATIHAADDLLPPEYVERFTTSAGVPKTWGDAILLRIQKQGAAFRRRYPNGSPITGSVD
jgi:RHS repeat-associated protein